MATTNQVMCSVILILMLAGSSSTLSLSVCVCVCVVIYKKMCLYTILFNFDWLLFMVLPYFFLDLEATTTAYINPKCYTPPNKQIPCSDSKEERQACKNECIQENYDDATVSLCRWSRFVACVTNPDANKCTKLIINFMKV